MKTILSLLLSASICLGQNILVNFYTPNQPFPGLTNYPAQTLTVSWSTNSPGWQTNMLVSDFVAYTASFQAAYLAESSNAIYQVTIPLSLTSNAWWTMYQQMPIGIFDSSNRQVAVSALWSSWKSGTNSASQTNAIITSALQQDQFVWTYLNQIIIYLSRLGPGLNAIYQPTQDPVGH